jgi:hypothetical protein
LGAGATASIFEIWLLVMVFNATFNNITVISWRSILLMEETEVPAENDRPAASRRQIISHNVVNVWR